MNQLKQFTQQHSRSLGLLLLIVLPGSLLVPLLLAAWHWLNRPASTSEQPNQQPCSNC